MKKVLITVSASIAAIAIILGSTYNGLINKQESVSESFGQVQAVYQRRLDLIPNLVETVKAYAKHEKDTFIAVTKARSMASQYMGNTSMNNASHFKQFAASQSALSGALGRLMVVVEKYPDLKANQNFLALQNQLEGTENRISVARQRFNSAVKIYNTAIRQFPGNLVAKLSSGFEEKPYFQASKEAASAPKVKF
jgi:LemA protein